MLHSKPKMPLAEKNYISDTASLVSNCVNILVMGGTVLQWLFELFSFNTWVLPLLLVASVLVNKTIQKNLKSTSRVDAKLPSQVTYKFVHPRYVLSRFNFFLESHNNAVQENDHDGIIAQIGLYNADKLYPLFGEGTPLNKRLNRVHDDYNLLLLANAQNGLIRVVDFTSKPVNYFEKVQATELNQNVSAYENIVHHFNDDKLVFGIIKFKSGKTLVFRFLFGAEQVYAEIITDKNRIEAFQAFLDMPNEKGRRMLVDK